MSTRVQPTQYSLPHSPAVKVDAVRGSDSQAQAQGESRNRLATATAMAGVLAEVGGILAGVARANKNLKTLGFHNAKVLFFVGAPA